VPERKVKKRKKFSFLDEEEKEWVQNIQIIQL
jgi:hypothetical protein